MTEYFKTIFFSFLVLSFFFFLPLETFAKTIKKDKVLVEEETIV